MTAEQTNQDAVLDRLRKQARELIAELPGPLRRLRLRSGETSVEVEWPAAGETSRYPAADAVEPGAEPAAQPGANGRTGVPPGRHVLAPIVGTFYRSPEPGADPFVQVDDVIEVGQVIGIVEAMKLMIPVMSDRAGRVRRVLVPDGQPVEYGERLVALGPEQGA